MLAEDTHWFKFSQDVTDTSLVECPACKQFSPLREWDEVEILCEDCGSHIGMKCPRCEDRFDSVDGENFQVKESAS